MFKLTGILSCVKESLVNQAELKWQCCGQTFLCGTRALIVGIINVTPDSFSDGGRYFAHESAVRRAGDMLDEGADIIDIGGESSRPGAESVAIDEELDRVIPVLQKVKEEFPDAVVSVDTYKYEVARIALEEGASIINDITGLRKSPELLPLLAETGAGVVIMHMQGTPRTMQQSPHYDDVLKEIADFLKERTHAARKVGIEEDQIVVDPGIGFGKTLEHNLSLLAEPSYVREQCKRPVLIGASRKSFIGMLLDGIPTDERAVGSLAAALTAVTRGADIVRVHDVKQTRQALAIYNAIAGNVSKGG